MQTAENVQIALKTQVAVKMIISSLRVLELNEKYNLIEGLCERELTNPEGIDLELRVGSVEKIVGPSYLGLIKRSSAKTEIIGDIKRDKEGKIITLNPRDYLGELETQN